MIEVTPQEFDFIRVSIKSAYPTFNVMPDQYSIRMWYRMLGDLDYKLQALKAAVPEAEKKLGEQTTGTFDLTQESITAVYTPD